MGRIHEGVRTFNATVRTLLALVACGALGVASFLGFSEYTKRDREIAEARAVAEQLTKELEIKTAQVERLEASLRLLKTDQRLARLDVLGIERDDSGKAVRSSLQFVELSPAGDTISEPRRFDLPGDVVYIDNWIVKFDDRFVEQADIERGTSLCLFRRIFSEEQRPGEGISLDAVGMRPQAYAHGGQLTEFEKKLWSEFWEFANDEKKAAEMGIRAANGEAVSVQVREGKSYMIELRASGGLSIRPVDQVQQ
jgi:hypothetical protein